jgi:hypothetical protein
MKETMQEFLARHAPDISRPEWIYAPVFPMPRAALLVQGVS